MSKTVPGVEGELRHPQLGEPIAVYEYTRLGGAVAFVVCRFDPKDFRPAHPTSNGRWAWNLNGAPTLLYHLPLVDGALERGEEIWIVDGEKDADALIDAGVIATCCARAQGWSLELAEELIGARRVRIVADNDDGPGLKQALDVREKLLAVTGLGSVDIEIVRAAVGKDAYDHLDAGKGVGDFVLIEEKEWLDAEEAWEWEPLKAEVFLELPEPGGVELLGPLARRGGRTVIGGDSGHGKTTFAFAITDAVVKGGEFLGYAGAGLGPALVIDLEQGVRSIKRGIREAGLDKTDTYVLSLPDGLALDQNPQELARLERTVDRLAPVLIVLDPYYKAHRGDANEERGVTDLMRNLDRLRSDYLFGLILPAHVRKEQQTGGARKLTLADIAGSGAISRGAEVVLAVERLSHGRARLRFLKDRDGDLPVGEFVDLKYSREEGFELVEKALPQSVEEEILKVKDSGWLTLEEWTAKVKAAKLVVNQADVRRTLDRLQVTRDVTFMEGPPGRKHNAHCWTTSVDSAPRQLWEEQEKQKSSLLGEADSEQKKQKSTSLLSASPAFSIGEAEGQAASSSDSAPQEPTWAEIESAALELQRRTGQIGRPLSEVIAFARGEGPWHSDEQTSPPSSTSTSGESAETTSRRTTTSSSSTSSGTGNDASPADATSPAEPSPGSTDSESSASAVTANTSTTTEDNPFFDE